jgi:hypothetical protein
LVEELLTTYNVTLETRALRKRGGRVLLPRVDELLERNRRLRALFTPPSRHPLHGCHRQDPFYRFPSQAAWPVVLGGWNRFPTLLYRFLLLVANREAFVNQGQPHAVPLVHAANQGQPTAMEAEHAVQHAAVQVQPAEALWGNR